MVIDYTSGVIQTFSQYADSNLAKPMAKYMKNRFIYFGIKSPLRKEISKPYLAKANLPNIIEIPQIVRKFWAQPQRELQYFAVDLLQRYSKEPPIEWIKLYEELICRKSWWDTVDGLAAWQVGDYFKKFPDQLSNFTQKWMDSENIWLQRTCLIFQLRYKDQTDFQLLKSFIERLSDSKEFFIRKAIGWSLRQHSKINPEAVKEFVSDQPMSNLSQREALKLID
jgi:3-methyladenine DNA glycosylase AlkD